MNISNDFLLISIELCASFQEFWLLAGNNCNKTNLDSHLVKWLVYDFRVELKGGKTELE